MKIGFKHFVVHIPFTGILIFKKKITNINILLAAFCALG